MKPKHILIVDDEATVATLLQRILEAFGQAYKVEMALSGAEALERLREQTFDMVITDYAMPGMDGLELAAATRAMRPGMKIILISGSYQLGLGQRAQSAGLDRYLRKPLLPDAFANAVENVLNE